MSVYWIVKHTSISSRDVCSGCESYKLIRNTKNKKRADNLIKLLQNKSDNNKEENGDIEYFVIDNVNKKDKYVAFLYNKNMGYEGHEIWEKEPEKNWLELTDNDVNKELSGYSVNYDELIKYKNRDKKNKNKWAAVYPLKLTKPNIEEIKRYWDNYIYRLNEDKVIKYLILHNRKESHPPYHDNFEISNSFTHKDEAEKEMINLKKEYPNNDIEILEQKDSNSKYIAILYNEEGEYEGNEFWTQDIETKFGPEGEKGWEEIDNDEDIPNEYVEYKNNRGLFAATISL